MMVVWSASTVLEFRWTLSKVQAQAQAQIAARLSEDSVMKP